MGYTHYWYTAKELPLDTFIKYSEKVKTLLSKPDVKIQYEYDEPEPPVVSKDEIRFNGRGENGHETFMLTRKNQTRDYESEEEIKQRGRTPCFNFCKTARKPYDKYVCACLLLAKIMFGEDISISSDGDFYEWQEGIDLLKKKLNMEIKITGDERDWETATYEAKYFSSVDQYEAALQ